MIRKQYEHMKRPWLRHNFNDGKLYKMNVQYIIDHAEQFDQVKILTSKKIWYSLREYDKDQMHGLMVWQESKEENIRKALESGTKPEEFPAIELCLHSGKELLSVYDGISRLRAFYKRGIENIVVKLYRG